MEVEEFRARTWTPGETVWVTTEGGSNICGTLISVFKDTVKLKVLNRPEKDDDFGWDAVSYREQSYHCRQIRKNKDEKPPPLHPRMAGGTETVSEKGKARRVRCVETGVEYTIGTAAALLGVRASSILASVTKGRAALGNHFEPVGWKPMQHRRVAVRCKETGEVFPMVCLAAEWLRIEATSVSEAVKHGKSVCGYHFERVKKEEI